MKIAYLGDTSPASTSRHRADALVRLGHSVRLLDPYAHLGAQVTNRFFQALHYRTGYHALQPIISRWIRDIGTVLGNSEIVWINGGELFGPAILRLIRQRGLPVVLYNNDDATGYRDGARFDMVRHSIHLYDLCASRSEREFEYRRLGARDFMGVWMGYDEVAHQPYCDPLQISDAFRSDVAFVGTCIPGEARDEFIVALKNMGLDVAIWGNGWQRARMWKQLRDLWRGAAISGRSYVAAIQGSKLALGLVSKGNRDQHTRRTFEIPYAGGLLCAERTAQHLTVFAEGTEALFWSDVEECARVCREIIRDEARRLMIREQGRRKVLALGVGNEDVCAAILARLRAERTAAVPSDPA
jgi:spore maturation protein CgeB